MSILRCKYCRVIVESYLLEDAIYICDDCRQLREKLKKNHNDYTDEYEENIANLNQTLIIIFYSIFCQTFLFKNYFYRQKM